MFCLGSPTGLVTVVVVIICFFFFKQKTAYELRISDWSSDVCSSDLTITYPDGRVLTLSYEFAHPEFCKPTTHECFGVYLQITRPLAVSSTDGYRLTFGYGTNTAPTKSYEQGVADWMTIESVLASNDAVAVCPRSSFPAPNSIWPNVRHTSSEEGRVGKEGVS